MRNDSIWACEVSSSRRRHTVWIIITGPRRWLSGQNVGCGILRTEFNSQNHVRKKEKKKPGTGPPGGGARGRERAQEEA